MECGAKSESGRKKLGGREEGMAVGLVLKGCFPPTLSACKVK